MILGPERLLSDIRLLGYVADLLMVKGSHHYVILPSFEIPCGRFEGKVIGLGIPAPPDYPRSVGASIHIKTNPQLYENGNVAGVRNIKNSTLGDEWKYWSHRFNWDGNNTTQELMRQIYGIFGRSE